MTAIDDSTLIFIWCFIYLLSAIIPSGLIFLILNKFLKKKTNFFAIYIGSILLPILPQFFFVKILSDNQITLLHYATWIISPLIGGYIGHIIFKSIKNKQGNLPNSG